MLLEIISTTFDQALQAKKYGADRVELVNGMLEEGLTPSLGLINKIKEEIGIPTVVMIRPHAKSFVYSKNDLDTMVRDIKIIEPVGIDSFVLGVLDENGNIDEEALKLLLSNIKNTPVAFHRAFEEVPDYKKAMDTLKKYPQIDRVLTTFGSKDLKKDISKIKEYLDYARSIDLNIIIGGGVNLDNLETLVTETDIEQIHIGSAAKINKNPIMDLDPRAVEKITSIIKSR
jgi:copper homeostasis protein